MTNYEKHKEHKRELHKKWYSGVIEYINRQKMKPCVDCHIQYNPWVMDFDHISGVKVMGYR